MNAGRLAKSLGAVALVLALGLGMAPAHAIVISLSPASQTVTAGDPFSVDVMLDTEGTTIFGYSFEVLVGAGSDDGAATADSVAMAASIFGAGGLPSGAIDGDGDATGSDLDLLSIGFSGSATLATINLTATDPGTVSLLFAGSPATGFSDDFFTPLSFSADDATVTVEQRAAVPEPGSLALVAGGLLLAGAARRRAAGTAR